MHVPSLYLDTSVIGGYFDDEWCAPTQELWRQMEMGFFRFVTSDVAVNEIALAPERVRELRAKAFPEEAILPVTQEAQELAAAYLRQGVLTDKSIDDAPHVAVCTVAQIEYLVSWNFKHLVNVHRRDAFNAVNRLQGYRPVRIVNPLELIYDDKDQEI